MNDKKLTIEETAREVDAQTGAFSKEKITKVEAFTDTLLDIYIPSRLDQVSSYAICKPIRTLLKSYRMFRSLPEKERRFQMSAELREVLLSPPEGIRPPDDYDIEAKTFTVVDAFLDLIGFLYGGIPSLVARNENRLVRAFELAVHLRYWDVLYRNMVRRAERLANHIRQKQAEIESKMKQNLTEEEISKLETERPQLTKSKKQLQDILERLRDPKRGNRPQEAKRIQDILEKGVS